MTLIDIGKLDGVYAPFQRSLDPEMPTRARNEAQAHLDALLGRYGVGSTYTKDGRQNVRLKNGESLAHRMVRDGFAVPAKDATKHVKNAEEIARKGKKGLWATGVLSATGEWLPRGMDLVELAARHVLDSGEELTR